MKYAMPVKMYGIDCVEIRFGDTPFPKGSIWPVTLNLPGEDMIIENGVLRQKTEKEKQIYKNTVDAFYAQQEEGWQQSKSPSLKILENIYVDFLTNMWTPALRIAELIPVDYTITVENTDEPTNMYLLIQLRSKNYDEYDKMASEFLRLKTAIISNGGIMSKVRVTS